MLNFFQHPLLDPALRQAQGAVQDDRTLKQIQDDYEDDPFGFQHHLLWIINYKMQKVFRYAQNE